MKNLFSLVFILSIALTACANTSPTPLPETPNALPDAPTSLPTSPIPTPQISPPQSPPPIPKGDTVTTKPPPLKTDLVNRAIADLAKRLSIATDDVVLISTRNDEFPAANFGCVDRFKMDAPTKSRSTLPGSLSQPDADVSPAFVIATEITLDVPSHTTRYIYRGKGIQLVFCFEQGY